MALCKLTLVNFRSRCFAFVVFKDASSVNKVFEAGDHAINSKKVDVKRAKAKPGKMFIGGLKQELTDEQIRTHFEQYGTILEFEMPFDKVKKQRKGFGFITFEREETMKDLLKKGKEKIEDCEVDLKKATPRADNFAPGGGPMGGASGAPGQYGGAFDYGYDYYGQDYYGYGWAGSMGGYGPGMGAWGSYGGGSSRGGTGGGKMRGRGGQRSRPY